MKVHGKRWLGTLLASLILVLTFSSVAFAAVDPNVPLGNLRTQIALGKYTSTTQQKVIDYTNNQYKLDGGGVALYSEVINITPNSMSDPVFTAKFESLKRKDKQDILEDVFSLAQAMAYDTAHSDTVAAGGAAVTDDTVNAFLELVQNESGMGSQMLAMLLQNTKPDFVSANRIYEPFSGTVGTILGVISILIMAFLGITMALDLAYIAIPGFQLLCGGEQGQGGAQGQSGSGGNFIGGLISKEAKSAVQGSEGGQGQGDKKSAIGQYFKHRVWMLVMLGICLLYLVSGNLWSGIAGLIDMLSGFLGF